MFTEEEGQLNFAPSLKPFLRDKTIVITGASRGIGRMLALRAAKDGANVVVIAKTTTPNPKLPGTIFSVADEIERAGGKALAISCDIRSDEQIEEAVRKTVERYKLYDNNLVNCRFGKIDILVNNASAIFLRRTTDLTMKNYDLMHQINVRGTFAFSKACIPHMKHAENPHILTMSPPLSMKPYWFKNNVAYTMSKYGMSMVAMGLSAELKGQGIAANALWPKTMIFTAALQAIDKSMSMRYCLLVLNAVVDLMRRQSRRPQIVADAAYGILCQPSKLFTGNFCIDEDILRYQGISNLDHYSMTPGTTDLASDGYIEPDYVTPKTLAQVLSPCSKF